MKLYAFYTPSHRVLKDEWFASTLQDDYELKMECYDQGCPSGSYKSDGWTKAMFRKSNLVTQAIKENWGEIFIYSDVDVQFFRSTRNAILKCMQGKELAIQRDSPAGVLCAGFFACRANRKTLKLWQDIQEALMKTQNGDDQDFLNHLLLEQTNGLPSLRRMVAVRLARYLGRYDERFIHSMPYIGNPYQIKWTYFPIEFFGGGTSTGRQWQPGMSLEIPKNIILHHANWTIGVANKIAQLKFVREKVRAISNLLDK